MSANFEAKKQIVEEIKEKIKASKSVVLVKSCGLTVAEDTEMRREFRKNNVEYKVLKNTLIRRAVRTKRLRQKLSLDRERSMKTKFRLRVRISTEVR